LKGTRFERKLSMGRLDRWVPPIASGHNLILIDVESREIPPPPFGNGGEGPIGRARISPKTWIGDSPRSAMV
jgi:hypothetical protein